MPRVGKQVLPPPKREKWYKVADAARMLGVSTETLRKLRVSGKIKTKVAHNGRWVFPESEIERLLTPMSYDEYIKKLCKY